MNPIQNDHIRGRVRQMRPGFVVQRRRAGGLSAWSLRRIEPLFGWEVVNVRTGVVLASDNGCVQLDRAVTECARMVEIARLSVFWGFARKRLR